MDFGRFSVEKKYVILALMIAILIFGVFSKMTMNTQLSPDTAPPMVTVVVPYPGAAARDVSSEVAKPMEEAFAKLEGISDIKSTSQDFIGIFNLTFDYTTDVNQAAIDIQNTITRIKQELPESIEEPQVLKFSTSDMPVMTIGIRSETLDTPALRSIADKNLLGEFQLVEGVAAVDLFGGYNPQVQVVIDGIKAASYGLSPEKVAQTLAVYNVTAPGGQITQDGRDLLIRVEDSFQEVEDLSQLAIPTRSGGVVSLGSFAEVYLGIEDKESAYNLNSEEALALSITKKTDANTVKVIESIHEKIAVLEVAYPQITFEVASDDAVFTNQMVDNMTSSVVIAIVMTMIVILLFIGHIGQSLVVSISMPLVFLSTLGLMRMFSMDLDLVTLSALILSIGFVVDGAVVVVEAISDQVRGGKTIRQAAIDGTREVALPSIAGVTTTLIVLVPLLFVEGFVGEMFRPLSLTLIFAIGSSIVVALLMIPLLSVLLAPLELPRISKHILRFSDPFNKMMNALMFWYIGITHKVLANKKRTFALLLAALASSGAFIYFNGMEMLPKFDSGVTYVTLEMAPGTPLEDTLEAFEALEGYLSKQPQVVGYDTKIGRETGSTQMGDFGMMGADQGITTVNLTSRKDRSLSIWEFQSALREMVEGIPGVNRYVVKEKGGTAVTSAAAPLAVKITGKDLDVLYHLADELMAQMASVPGTTNLYKSYNNDYEEVTLAIDANRSKALGLTTADVSRQLYGAMAGIKATDMTIEGMEGIDINVRYEASLSADIDTLRAIPITTPLGFTVPLGELTSEEVLGRSNLVERENLNYTVRVLGFTEERAFSHVVMDIQDQIDAMSLPSGYEITFTGEQETLTESVGDMIFLLSLAVFFVYLILVPQFKSFLHPLTIMMAIPLVAIGIAPALGLSQKVMSMPVLLGIILLAGTVVNNAILLVDAINRQREAGRMIHEAIEEAIRLRFRPIMMTAISDVVGMLPLALQLALGSERFSPLAITVIGGITAATFLTIVVIPLIYASFEGLKEYLFIEKALPRE